MVTQPVCFCSLEMGRYPMPCPCPHHIPKKGLNDLAQVASCAVCLLPPAPPNTPSPSPIS